MGHGRTESQPANVTLARVISTGLQANRQLDRANAHEHSLATDFGRFGIVLWDDMETRDVRTSGRRTHLKWFNKARNALAHDDTAKLDNVMQLATRST